MTQLHDPDIGTPKADKVGYALHRMQSFTLKDVEIARNTIECLAAFEQLSSTHIKAIRMGGEAAKASKEQIEKLVVMAQHIHGWAGEMREGGYHSINTTTFITLWAGWEAGIENVAAAIIQTSRGAAERSSGKFRADRYPLNAWPWSDEICLEMAQKLDVKAKNDVPDGGWDVAARSVKLFDWLGYRLEFGNALATTYNEASLIRNVIMHRYGRIGPNDALKVPHLKEWVGRAVPMTWARLLQYYQSLLKAHLVITKAIRPELLQQANIDFNP